MKRITALLITFVLLYIFTVPAYAQPDNINEEVNIIIEPNQSVELQESQKPSEDFNEPPSIEAEAAILIDQDTGKILYEKNAHKPLYPASTTKILTAILALEYGDLEETVTVGNEANLCEPDGSKAGLDLHEQITMENLIRGLLLPSGNDAAYTIAVHLGRRTSNNPNLSVKQALDRFAELMNEKARELGAKNSHFVNPHGYHDDEHYTTAYDLALITREAMKYDFFKEVVGTRMFTLEDWNGVDAQDPNKKEIRYWRNSNSLIQENDKYYYEDATGVKTGYTSKAGHCLVTSATRNGMDLISVVLNDSKDGKWVHSASLMDYGFNSYQIYRPISKGQRIQTVGLHGHSEDDPGWLDIITDGEYSDIISKEDINKFEQEITWNLEVLYVPSGDKKGSSEEQNSIYLKAPITQGQEVGTVTIKLNGKELSQIPLVAARGVEQKRKIIENILPSSPEGLFIPIWLWVPGTFILLIMMLRISALRRRRRRKKYLYTKRRYY